MADGTRRGLKGRFVAVALLLLPYVFATMQQATTIIVITQPRVILKVLTWCIVITTLIKTVTLTYVISDIRIVIFGINISL